MLLTTDYIAIIIALVSLITITLLQFKYINNLTKENYRQLMRIRELNKTIEQLDGYPHILPAVKPKVNHS